MIFFDQFKVPTIKFGKCFAEFLILIALLKKFGSKEFVTIIDIRHNTHTIWMYKKPNLNIHDI